MRQPVRIAASILAADFATLGAEVAAITRAGADMVHFDVMDGHFVPSISFGPALVAALRRHSTLPFDVHLMVRPVDPHIDAFVRAGADIISFHPEAETHPHRTLRTIRAAGVRPGIVLNPGSPLTLIEELVADVDLILAMTVNPGYGGQKFIDSQYDKIARIRAMIDGEIARTARPPIDLEVDGGINPDTAPRAIAAGADLLVAGSAVFGGGSETYGDNIERLRQP